MAIFQHLQNAMTTYHYVRKDGFAEMDFKSNLRTFRLNSHLTQTQLAEKTDISLRTIQRYEKGTCKPDITVIKKLADTLNISTDKLIGDSSKRKTAAQKQNAALNYTYAVADLIKSSDFDDDFTNQIKSIINKAVKESKA